MKPKIRTHLSADSAAIVLREVDAADTGEAGAYKPRGFWYEVDGDWRRWCESEQFGSYSYIHSVDIRNCNLLMIDSLRKLDEFHREYSFAYWRSLLSIDWKKVSQKYDGVEIAPYQWERRLAPDFGWYYGWDVASGVIWRPRDATVKYVGVYTPQKEEAVDGERVS